MAAKTNEIEIKIRSPITCFYCWNLNRPEKLKWIAQSQTLDHDPQLGEDQLRFHASHFTPEGQAIDPDGQPTSNLACSNCHLPIPRESLKYRPFFVSVAGTPSSGKTYFQTAMIHRLRSIFAEKACLEFEEVEIGTSNYFLENESTLFHNPESNDWVSIAKTQEFGDHYRLVQFNQELVSYPKPFVFKLRPTHLHPKRSSKEKATRLLAFYDNAGESFEKGRDSLVNPVTRHLGLSHVLMFCLDLEQEDAFQKKYGKSKRPDANTGKQLACFEETTRRVRELSISGQTEKNLIVVVTKFDRWNTQLGIQLKKNLWQAKERFSVSAFDTQTIEETSLRLRKALFKRIPEWVDACERFSNRVLYVPVSAIGSQPEIDENGLASIRPRNIRPVWTEVPLVYALTKWCGGLIPYSQQAKMRT